MSSFIPGGAFTVLMTGVLLILASISIMLNKFIKITCFSLAGLLLIFITTIHIPGLFTVNSEFALVELLKDTGLMGGAIMIAVYFDLPKAETTK
jgi:putative oxidoreductase